MTDLIKTPENHFYLSPEEVEQFHRQGYIGPFTLYSPDEMKILWRQTRLQALDRSHAAYQSTAAVSGNTNISNYDRHLDIDFLAEHICRREIVDRVSSILGPDVICWRTEFFPKHSGEEGTDWHQADTFANASGTPQIVWPEDSKFGGTITVWSAFTEATTDNGCLQFIPGTHKTMFYDETKRMHYCDEQTNSIEKNGIMRGFFGYDYRELQIDPNWAPNENDATSITMEAGQFIIFWSTLMHASHPHSGKTREMRMGYATRYVPSSVQVYPDTNVVEEYGGSVSLEKYGSVVVCGMNKCPSNRIVTHTTRGRKF
ncbi:L-threonyl-(L-threonyl-carrier protein) 4-chlorinase [Pseudomonas sp. IT-P171]|uniref:chlorinating enzyme n=1 Tax=Pseudomonas sp. IT-P171 TaxID=3026453 RepID=UPI0039E11171